MFSFLCYAHQASGQYLFECGVEGIVAGDFAPATGKTCLLLGVFGSPASFLLMSYTEIVSIET